MAESPAASRAALISDGSGVRDGEPPRDRFGWLDILYFKLHAIFPRCLDLLDDRRGRVSIPPTLTPESAQEIETRIKIVFVTLEPRSAELGILECLWKVSGDGLASGLDVTICYVFDGRVKRVAFRDAIPVVAVVCGAASINFNSLDAGDLLTIFADDRELPARY